MASHNHAYSIIMLYTESVMSNHHINLWSPLNRPTLDPPPQLYYTHILIYSIYDRDNKSGTRTVTHCIMHPSLQSLSLSLSLLRMFTFPYGLCPSRLTSNVEGEIVRIAYVCNLFDIVYTHVVVVTMTLSENKVLKISKRKQDQSERKR